MAESFREAQILDLLRPRGEARVQDLARVLNVTDETIRRLLRRLEGRGLITKTHGGAHLRDIGPEASFAQRMEVHRAAKRKIAAALARRLPDGSALFLDVGSTTAYVAEALRDRRDLMVVTNSLAVAQALASRNGNRVFMAGGELRAHDGGAFGDEALAFVRRFRLSFAVLSAAAVDETGFLLRDLREADMARAMIAGAGAVWVAADASKFAEKAPICLGGLGLADELVTDVPPPPALKAALATAGVTFSLA